MSEQDIFESISYLELDEVGLTVSHGTDSTTISYLKLMSMRMEDENLALLTKDVDRILTKAKLVILKIHEDTPDELKLLVAKHLFSL